MAARCKTHGISQSFVSIVLQIHKLSNDVVSKLNLDIANICKSNSFNSTDKNNISMNFLYKDGLHLLHSGKELTSKVLSGKKLTSKVHFFSITYFYKITHTI